MQLSKEEYARKIIHTGSSVQIENSVTRVAVRHHEAYHRDGIFNQHVTDIRDSYHNASVLSFVLFNRDNF